MERGLPAREHTPRPAGWKPALHAAGHAARACGGTWCRRYQADIIAAWVAHFGE